MKGDNPYVMRALYIILVPLVLLMILLNSGWLQRLLPAGSVHGETYSVVRYNFYYFEQYHAFLEENEEHLDELGFNPQKAEGEQIRSDGQTWKEFFQAQGEALLSQTAYYIELAKEADYQFSQEELAPVSQRMDEHQEQYTLYGVSADRYFASYYGAGMTKDAYEQEFTRVVQAQAYRNYLIGQAEPSETAVSQWISEHPDADGQTLQLRVISLEALPERTSGEVGPEQLDALTAKLNRLAQRYQDGTPFETLQNAFSSRAAGDENGALENAVWEDLPSVLADVLSEQDVLVPGSVFSAVDPDTGIAYFAILDGLGGSAQVQRAQAALRLQMIETQEESAVSGYQVERNPIGMLLATA